MKLTLNNPRVLIGERSYDFVGFTAMTRKSEPQVWKEQDDRYIFGNPTSPSLEAAQGFRTLL